MVITNDLTLLIDKVNYEVNFVDYPEDVWTVPVVLTQERAKRIIEDASVRKVRFSPTLSISLGSTFEFEGRYLVYNSQNKQS